METRTSGHKILSLPTKANLELFTHRVEKAIRQDIKALQVDTAHLGGRVESLETQWGDINPTLQALTERYKTQDQRINSLLDQMDDLENSSLRVNICIRGLPESTAPRDIVPTLQGVFQYILGREALEHIEIDHAHRALCPPAEDPDKPRDIICKLHKYSLKGSIMFHVSDICYMDFNATK